MDLGILIRTTRSKKDRTRHISVSTKKERELRSLLNSYIYLQNFRLSLFFEMFNICGFLRSLPRTIPAVADHDHDHDHDDDDDNDETMHRHITEFRENTRRWHERTPGLRVLPLASLVIIITVAFGNVLMWTIAGVVLVNTITSHFFIFFIF